MIPIIYLRVDEMDALVAGITIEYRHSDFGMITIQPPQDYKPEGSPERRREELGDPHDYVGELSDILSGDAVTHIDISIPKDVALKFLRGGDSFYEAAPTISDLIVKESKRLADEIRANGEKAMMIKRLQEEGVMNKSSETASDCLKCLNGRTLREDESCPECKRFCDNYGELFPMR